MGRILAQGRPLQVGDARSATCLLHVHEATAALGLTFLIETAGSSEYADLMWVTVATQSVQATTPDVVCGITIVSLGQAIRWTLSGSWSPQFSFSVRVFLR